VTARVVRRLETARVLPLQRIVDAVVAVSERQGSTSGDAAWFGNETWSEVRIAASAAAAVLRQIWSKALI
jgi:hypothetical protein